MHDLVTQMCLFVCLAAHSGSVKARKEGRRTLSYGGVMIGSLPFALFQAVPVVTWPSKSNRILRVALRREWSVKVCATVSSVSGLLGCREHRAGHIETGGRESANVQHSSGSGDRQGCHSSVLSSSSPSCRYATLWKVGEASRFKWDWTQQFFLAHHPARSNLSV